MFWDPRHLRLPPRWLGDFRVSILLCQVILEHAGWVIWRGLLALLPVIFVHFGWVNPDTFLLVELAVIALHHRRW